MRNIAEQIEDIREEILSETDPDRLRYLRLMYQLLVLDYRPDPKPRRRPR